MMNFLVKVLLILILLSFSAKAQEVGAGLWCDTEEQVRMFLTEVNGNSQETVSRINEKYGENACVASYVQLHRGTVLGTVKNKDGTWDITEILVVAVGVNGRFVPVEPKVFYTAFLREERSI